MTIPEREHHNADGTPKHSWPTRRQASDARRRMNMSHVNIYRCRTCGHWHHGHRTTNTGTRPRPTPPRHRNLPPGKHAHYPDPP